MASTTSDFHCHWGEVARKTAPLVTTGHCSGGKSHSTSYHWPLSVVEKGAPLVTTCSLQCFYFCIMFCLICSLSSIFLQGVFVSSNPRSRLDPAQASASVMCVAGSKHYSVTSEEVWGQYETKSEFASRKRVAATSASTSSSASSSSST